MFLKINLFLILLLSINQFCIAQYKIYLPKNTGYNSGYATVINHNQYVRIFKKQSKKQVFIEFYDLTTGKLVNQLTINNLNLVESFYLESNNTIWLFDEGKGTLIKTVDGVKKQEIDVLGNISIPKSGYYPYAGDMKWSPIHFYKNNFYLINSFDRTAKNTIKRVTDKEFIQSVNILTKKVDNKAPLPWLFFERDYGMMNKFSSLRKENLIIIAPNFSNEIFLFNLENGNLISPILDNKNKYYSIAEPLLTKDKFDISGISEQDWSIKMEQHFKNNNEYINIIYDPYKKQYYRTLLIKDPKLKKETPLEIIVLDEDFAFVKAKKLNSDYNPAGMFVTEKGINILNYTKYKENSDILIFDTFKL